MMAEQRQKIIDAIVDRKTNLYDSVYFYGTRERAVSIVNEIEEQYRKRYPKIEVVRVDGEIFHNEIMHNIRTGNVRVPQWKGDLYIFENVEYVAGRVYAEQLLYETLDWMLQNNRQIVVTGSAPTASIENLAPRICAQLDGGISLCVDAM